MASKYGINVELSNEATSAYSIENSRPIAVVGDDTKLDGLSVYSTVEKALEAVGDGTIKETLTDLQATGIYSQIIISAFQKEEGEEESATITKVNAAVNALKNAETKLSAKPKFILCVGYNDAGVYETLRQVAANLRAVYAIELNATTETEALQAVENLNYRTALVSFQKVIRTDGEIRPASAFLISQYAGVMAETEFGFSEGFSNKTISGVIGIDTAVELVQGSDCEADRLRDAGIVCIIADDGIRSWGGETRDDDFPSIHTVVILYTIIDTIFENQKTAIDQRVTDVLKSIKDAMNAFFTRLLGNNVLLGFDITIPSANDANYPNLNTKENVAAGKIYIILKAQETPLLKNLTNKLIRVDSYSDTLIENL